MTRGQIIKAFIAGIERPCEGIAAGISSEHIAWIQAQHLEQGGLIGAQSAGDAGCRHADQIDRGGVTVIGI